MNLILFEYLEVKYSMTYISLKIKKIPAVEVVILSFFYGPTRKNSHKGSIAMIDRIFLTSYTTILQDEADFWAPI